MATSIFGALWAAGVVVVLAWVVRRVFTRRGRWGQGPAASGAIYELLNEDKRNAIEIILEERAEYTDPETKDGDLPQLKGTKPVARTQRTN